VWRSCLNDRRTQTLCPESTGVPPPPGGLHSLSAPLKGIRVLDVSRFLAGPYAGWILASLGADVVKIEDPDRPDEARSVGPYFQHGQSLYFAALNAGKRSLAVRLGDPEGREVVLELARTADVVLDNQKPGVMDKLGLGSAALRAANPSLVTVSLSGFGANGPMRNMPGYDYTIQAVSGVMSMTGEPGSPPGKAGISYVDHSGGLAAALAVCAALVKRASSGEGGHVDLALYDVQTSMMSYLAAWQLNAGFEGSRYPAASHPTLVPAQNFETADGYVSLFIGNDGMWARLAATLDDAFLLSPRLASNRGRLEWRDEVVSHLGRLLLAQSSSHWVSLFGGCGVPCARVNTLAEAMHEPQLEHRSMVATLAHPAYGPYSQVMGPLPALGDGEVSAAPLLGEHSRELLRAAGVTEDRIARLAASGVIRTVDPVDRPPH
jgi:crotonobetainyl-CoA:carnitine CoA-transferase CaiB-like acyl-CoA transferase